MIKKIFVLLAVMTVALAGTAFAANSLNNGAMAISVGMGDSVFGHAGIPLVPSVVNNVVDISGRLFVAKDMAIYGGFGLQSDSGDADGLYLGLTVGGRKYLKTADFSPFIAGEFSYIAVDCGPVDVSVIDLAGLFGAEYFVGPQFSLEGAVGIGLGQADDGTTKDTYFGTRTVGVRANFYF